MITEVAEGVTRLKVGDEVYTRLAEVDRGTEWTFLLFYLALKAVSLIKDPGSWSEYVKSAEDHVALKPKSLSFGEAASIPLAATTAMQALRKYKGSLSGKTVFVPAGYEWLPGIKDSHEYH